MSYGRLSLSRHPSPCPHLEVLSLTDDREAENQELQQDLPQEERLRQQFEDQAAQLEKELAQATNERDDLQRKYATTQANLKNLLDECEEVYQPKVTPYPPGKVSSCQGRYLI